MFVKLKMVRDKNIGWTNDRLYNTDCITSVSPDKSGDMCWLVGSSGRAIGLVLGTLDEVQQQLNSGEQNG